MPSSVRCKIGPSLFATLLAWSAVCGAQTLHPRPPGAPQPPAQPLQSSAPSKLALPIGTSLQVEILQHVPMKAGEAIEGRLMHPLFADGKLVATENTVLHGKVVDLKPDSHRRWQARLHGDFTPFHIASVHFDEIVLPDGPLSITASSAADGAPVLRLTAPGASPRRSFLARQWATAQSDMHDRLAVFTAPGKADRALQLLYRQLPYHPERIEAHTAWSIELTAPVELSGSLAATAPSPQPVPSSGKQETWAIHALLLSDLTSAHAHPGTPVHALVAEPVYDRNGQLAVPQGAILIGKVTAAHAARSLGRNGVLRFTFQQIQFPEGFNRQVEGSLAGAATEKEQNLTLDAEGTIKPRNQSSVVVPLLLAVLGAHALDEDGSVYANSAVASNGFGLMGRIVGIAAGSRNLAAGIGCYAAALSFYENFLRGGRDVSFPKNTRIEIETTPLRAPVLAPDAQ
jgi:hypothetical protein